MLKRLLSFILILEARKDGDFEPKSSQEQTRKNLHNMSKYLLSGILLPTLGTQKPAQALEIPPFPSKGFQTKSGLKFFDYTEGEGNTPRYGDLVSFFYTGYFRANPSAKLEIFDSSYLNYGKEPFLHKHGNGRVLRGLDEAIHTMKPGSKRRVILPKTLGFSEFGVGPVPIDPFRRRKLGKLLDFVEADQGELIYDIELAMVAQDENDQGYYDDVPVSQDEVRQLVLKSLNVDNPELYDKMMKSTPEELRARGSNFK